MLLDSPELAAANRRALDIPRDRAAELGRSAVAAAEQGSYLTHSGQEVSIAAAVATAVAAKCSIAPNDPLPTAAPKSFPSTRIGLDRSPHFSGSGSTASSPSPVPTATNPWSLAPGAAVPSATTPIPPPNCSAAAKASPSPNSSKPPPHTGFPINPNADPHPSNHPPPLKIHHSTSRIFRIILVVSPSSYQISPPVMKTSEYGSYSTPWFRKAKAIQR